MSKKKLTHEEFLEKVLQKNKHYANGDFILKGLYIGSDKPIECHCNVHNLDWSPTPSNLYKGCGCPNCGRESATKKISRIMIDRTPNVRSRMLTHEIFLER